MGTGITVRITSEDAEPITRYVQVDGTFEVPFGIELENFASALRRLANVLEREYVDTSLVKKIREKVSR